jgi:hypothetical protein
MPTDENSLRSLPSHSGQTVSGSSENDWTASSAWPQAVHAYW